MSLSLDPISHAARGARRQAQGFVCAARGERGQMLPTWRSHVVAKALFSLSHTGYDVYSQKACSYDRGRLLVALQCMLNVLYIFILNVSFFCTWTGDLFV